MQSKGNIILITGGGIGEASAAFCDHTQAISALQVRETGGARATPHLKSEIWGTHFNTARTEACFAQDDERGVRPAR